MAVAGICAGCGRPSIGLLTCHTCSSRVCPQCIQGIGCKICGGIRKIK